ncbi:MAG: hypothetical protein ACLP1D_29655 [Xanthobacteraceae bacterium]|jgi:hypothetical protein
MVSAILRLKSDGAQVLLTAALLAGCALNMMLVWVYADRADDRAIGIYLSGTRAVAVAPVSTGSTPRPAESGGLAPAARQQGRDVATGGRVYQLRSPRPS